MDSHSALIVSTSPADSASANYSYVWVVASYAIAVVGSYIALTLMGYLRGTKEHKTRMRLHIASVFVLGSSIWSMHFVGMLAFKLDMGISYNPWMTLLSFLIAIVGTLPIPLIINTNRLSPLRIGFAALILGFAICAMHYTGMAAMEVEASLAYLLKPFVASVLIAILASAAALFLLHSFSKDTNSLTEFQKTIAAMIMGAAICGMHYTGMQAALFSPFPNCSHIASQDFGILGLAIIAVTSLVFVTALTLSYDMRERGLSKNAKSHYFPVGLVALSFCLTTVAILWTVADNIYIDTLYDSKPTNDAITAGILSKIDYSLCLSVFILFILPMAWFCTYRAIRTWRKEIEHTRQDLSENQAELQLAVCELEQSRKEALLAREASERANKVKGEFLANMSHEIRTPMNGILGMARLLMDTELKTDQHSWVEIINNSGENLMNIINDILDFSKINDGHLRLDTAPFDLYLTLCDITDCVVLQAQAKNIALIVKVDPATPRYLVGDAVRLKQVIINLLNNALKFTMHGHVMLDVAGHSISGTKTQLTINIRDTGIGIPKDKIDAVFDRFTQAEESTSRRFGGTGLGLSISRSLISLMGGAIHVESEVDVGTTIGFMVMLPVAPSHQSGPELEADLSGLGILVLHDTPIVRGIYDSYLRHWGMVPDYCDDAAEVIARLLRHHANAQPVQFVCFDYAMGAQRKLELIERIRVYPELSDIQFIVATNFGSLTASRLLNKKEIAALLTKPLLLDHLHDALSILWNARIRNEKIGLVTRTTIARARLIDDSKKKSAASFLGTRVLVVEDMAVNQLLMAKVLQGFGCSVDTAINGIEATKKIDSNDYDCVFMDCHMPLMDGFDATRQIRKREAEHNNKHTVVVALTADAMVGDREKCLAAGMDDYLNKPFKPEQIAQMLQKWVVKDKA